MELAPGPRRRNEGRGVFGVPGMLRGGLGGGLGERKFGLSRLVHTEARFKGSARPRSRDAARLDRDVADDHDRPRSGALVTHADRTQTDMQIGP